MYYEQQKLGYTEYREVILDNISRLVVNESYMSNNEDAFEHIVFKSYEKYANSKTENYTINQIVSLLNIFLDSLIRYEMDNELPEDSITIA
jgi:hypothetical protein